MLQKGSNTGLTNTPIGTNTHPEAPSYSLAAPHTAVLFSRQRASHSHTSSCNQELQQQPLTARK